MAERIEDYALIGDLQTAALVGRDGSIDWLCLPRFDSGACFAALLGTPRARPLADRAGRRASGASRAATATDTLVLETEFETDDGAVRVIDFMPPRGDDARRRAHRRGRRGRGARCASELVDPLRLRLDRPVGAARRRTTLRRDRRPGRARRCGRRSTRAART